MNITVIGGQGFIGRHLMETGRGMGHNMVSIDIEPGADIPKAADQLESKDFEVCERIIWSAGKLGTVETFNEMAQTIKANITDLVHVLKIAQASGISFTYITLGNDWLNPYSITKNCGRDFCRMFALDTNIQIATTYNVFGPYQKVGPVRKMIPYFLTQLIKGEPIELFFDGEQEVDLVYAPDLAKDILENDKGGEFEYGTAVPRSVKAVAYLCSEALAIKHQIFFTDEDDRHGETGDGAIAAYPMNTITPIEQAMKITADWYKENYERNK